MKKQKYKISQSWAVIIFLVVVFLGVFGLTTQSNQKTAQITGYAVKESATFCKGYDLDNLGEVDDLQPCVYYKDMVLSEMAEEGLLDMGIDPLLIFAVAQQESSCRPEDARGLLMVDDCRNGNLVCPDDRSRIKEGLKIFKKNYQTLKNKGLDGQELIHMTLFAHNRGIGTALRAVELMKTGAGMTRAMQESCYEVYNIDCFGTRALCRYDEDGNDKCVNPGYGAGYSPKILKKYENYCNELDGDIKQGAYEYSETKITRFGTYKLKPGFTITKQHDTDVYELLKNFSEDLVNECTTNIEVCVEQKKQEFNQEHEDVQFVSCGSSKFETVLYDMLEKMYDCFDVQYDNDCVCDITTDYPGVYKSFNDMSWTPANTESSANDFYAQYGLYFENPRNNEGTYDYDVKLRVGTLGVLYTQSDYLGRLNLINDQLMKSNKQFMFSEIRFKYERDESDGVNVFESQTDNLDGLKNLYLYIPKNEEKYYLAAVNDDGKLVTSDESIEKDFSEVDVCPVNKQKYVFCAQTNEKNPVSQEFRDAYYGTITEGNVQRNLLIRFALHIADNVPPVKLEQQKVTKQQASDSENTFAILEWAEPEEVPFSYIVYYSTQDLSAETIDSLEQKDQKIVLPVPSIYPITYSSLSYEMIACAFGPCQVYTDRGNAEIKSNEFFVYAPVPENRKIVYFLELPDSSQDYYFAITSTDHSQNAGQPIFISTLG